MTKEQFSLEAAKIAAGFFHREGRHVYSELSETETSRTKQIREKDLAMAVAFGKSLLLISGVKVDEPVLLEKIS